ncbi:MAG: NepR family anti-sigma factor [Hyphomonadaceae bacterium]
METMVNANKPPHEDSKAKKAAAGSSAHHKALIARNLKLVYGEVASEPIPDQMADLLEQLSEAKGKQS